MLITSSLDNDLVQQRYTADHAVRMILYVIMFSAVVGALVGVIRLLGSEYLWLGHANKIINPVLLVLALGSLLFSRYYRIDDFLLIALGVIPLGLIMGLLRSGELRYLLSHLFVAVFIASLYAVSMASKMSRGEIEWWLSKMSTVIMWSYAVVTSMYVLLIFVGGRVMYLGLSSNALLLPMAYYLVRGRWVMVMSAFVMITLSGKRGVLLAALAQLVVYILPGRRLTSKVIVAAASVIGIVIFSLWTLQYVDQEHFGGGLGSLINKWSLLNPFSDDFDLLVGSSGRLGEIDYSLRHFDKSVLNWIWGLGYGWSYFNGAYMTVSDTYNYVRHYIHCTPFNFLYLYGLPAALVFFAVMWSSMARAFRIGEQNRREAVAERCIVFYLISVLVASLTGYNLSINPMIWVFFGLLSSLVVRNRCADNIASDDDGHNEC